MSEIDTRLEGIIAAVWLHKIDNDEATKQIQDLLHTKQKEREEKLLSQMDALYRNVSLQALGTHSEAGIRKEVSGFQKAIDACKKLLSESEGGDESGN